MPLLKLLHHYNQRVCDLMQFKHKLFHIQLDHDTAFLLKVYKMDWIT